MALAHVTCYRDWNQHWRDGASVMLQTSLRMRRKRWKGLKNLPPGTFSTPLQLLAEVCSCTSGPFWRKCSLNHRNVLYFSILKWFREHFEATTYSNYDDTAEETNPVPSISLSDNKFSTTHFSLIFKFPLIWRCTYRASYCNVLMTNEMHNSYNQFLSHNFCLLYSFKRI